MTPYKILVVDDEDNIRTLVQTMLTGEGRQLVLAARGKDAIAMFRKERPNLTILDIDMPDIDGITVLREIRTIDPQAKVMVFTGGESPIVESQAKALGVTDFLRKGFALPSLAELQARGSQSTALEGTPSPTSLVRPRTV
ncbi:MAG TPA: response regulator [Nitrospiraceae bacterium]|nr:response regulator [Nitrospiraceae bacterium]